MPITLHDFSENFVVMATGLTVFGRACSSVGFGALQLILNPITFKTLQV